MQYIIVRSDINRIQARLFDILTIRIVNKKATLTQMYYDHKYTKEFLKALDFEKLHKVSFAVTSLEELEDLEVKLIMGKIDSTIKINLPNKCYNSTLDKRYSKIVVKAHFFEDGKRNMFFQKVSKTFNILDL